MSYKKLIPRFKYLYNVKYINNDRVRILKSFWNKIENLSFHSDEDCWNWTASVNEGGYGQLGFLGRPYISHRLSYVLYKGRIPKDLFVLHKCDNRRCVNPSHLFIGTAGDNNRDCIAKGRNYVRNNIGKPGARKFNESNIKEIFELFKGGKTHQEIADKFRIGRSSITKILNKQRYKEIEA